MDFGHGRFYRGKDAPITNYTHFDRICKGGIVKFCGRKERGSRHFVGSHCRLGRAGEVRSDPFFPGIQGMRVRDKVNTLDAEEGRMDTGLRVTSFSVLPAWALTMACMVKPLVEQSCSVATSRLDAAMRSPFSVSTKRLFTAWLIGMCTV